MPERGYQVGRRLADARAGLPGAAIQELFAASRRPAFADGRAARRTQQQPDEITALLRFYDADVDVVDRLAALAGRADQGTWWASFADVLPGWFKIFVGLEAVVEEAVLNRVVGGPAVMVPQLRHLLELAERDNVTLQIMPTAVAVHDGLGGPFKLLDFAEARSIGYIEYRNEAVYVQDRDEVEVYNLVAERLAERALSDVDSIDLIRARIAALT